MDIVTIGKITWDFIYKQNESNPKAVDDFILTIGGSATNVAIAASRLGLKSGVVGAVGYDWAPLKEKLEKEGVDVSSVSEIKDRTAFFIMRVNGPKKDTIAFRGASAAFGPEHVDNDYLKDAKIVHLSSMYPRICRKAMQGRDFITLDVGFEFPLDGFEEAKDVLAKTKYMFAKENELTNLTKKDVESSIKMAMDAGVKTILLKKADNVEIITKTKRKAVPIIKGNLYDIMGCGDAFSTGFLYSHLKGKNDEDACKFGIICAKLVSEKMGASASPTLEEAQKEFKKYY